MMTTRMPQVTLRLAVVHATQFMVHRTRSPTLVSLILRSKLTVGQTADSH